VAAEQRHIEVFVLSYVPNAIAGEKYNVGLVALERRDNKTRFADSRFITDTRELLTFDPDADVDVLDAFFLEIKQGLHDLENADVLLRTMLDSFSNTIQISDEKTVVISGDPAAEIDRLAALYVARR
jgi:hypothetical protein